MRCGGKLICRRSQNRSASRLWHPVTFHAAHTPLLRSCPLLRLSPSLSSNTTGFDQDDAAGVAAERAFDCHLLEQRMLLKLLHANAPSRCSHQRCQSIPAPAASAAPAQVVEPAILTPAAPTPQQRPAVPERQLPATPAVGTLSSESTVPMLRRLRRCHTPAQTVLVCLWCPTSSARDIHCIDTAAVAAQRRRPVYSTQYSN